MASINNVTITNGALSLTILTRRVKLNVTNTLQLIKAPTTRQNYAAGPKETKILDLLRYEARFTITGEIAAADYGTAVHLSVVGGTSTLTYADIPNIGKAPFSAAGSVEVAIDKLDLERSERETDEDTNKPATIPIVISCVAGTELGGA